MRDFRIVEDVEIINRAAVRDSAFGSQRLTGNMQLLATFSSHDGAAERGHEREKPSLGSARTVCRLAERSPNAERSSSNHHSQWEAYMH